MSTELSNRSPFVCLDLPGRTLACLGLLGFASPGYARLPKCARVRWSVPVHPSRRFRNSPAFRRAAVQHESRGSKGGGLKKFVPNNTLSDLRLKYAAAYAAGGFALVIQECSEYYIYTRNEYASTTYSGCVFLSRRPCQAIPAFRMRRAPSIGPVLELGGAGETRRLRTRRNRLRLVRFRPWRTKRSVRIGAKQFGQRA